MAITRTMMVARLQRIILFQFMNAPLRNARPLKSLGFKMLGL
jgi:hypothetical protein